MNMFLIFAMKHSKLTGLPLKHGHCITWTWKTCADWEVIGIISWNTTMLEQSFDLFLRSKHGDFLCLHIRVLHGRQSRQLKQELEIFKAFMKDWDDYIMVLSQKTLWFCPKTRDLPKCFLPFSLGKTHPEISPSEICVCVCIPPVAICLQKQIRIHDGTQKWMVYRFCFPFGHLQTNPNVACELKLPGPGIVTLLDNFLKCS